MDNAAVSGNEGLFQFGTLLPLWTFRPRPKITYGLPDGTPVLTCTVTKEEADCLKTDHSESSIGFEWVRTDDFITLNICLYLGESRVYWVVDICDPEIYEAIELWKRAGQIPIAFFVRQSETQRQLYHTVGMPPFNPKVGTLWTDPDHKPTAGRWEAMTELLDAWRRLTGTRELVAGITLQQVLGNVLLTKRWERLARRGLLVPRSRAAMSDFAQDSLCQGG
ncbi:hypothetical protein [Caballeronia telluris]|uniref:Uncharacterized protein n=1 Tax=Caballeronia telluris TaxID=326475 RepID=A0A158KCT4_9BURK|nr:hypothetical protein [Caballeronia telluris]SAL78855.1 hypothetical protein AWB66_05930 [Caballeronia telluris]